MATTAKVVKQLNKTKVVDFKANVSLLDHYTLSLWENENDMRAFVKSGEHQKAMKQSSKMASNIRSYHFEVDGMPTWKEAKSRLKLHGKTYKGKSR